MNICNAQFTVCAPESACCYDEMHCLLLHREKDCDANEWNSCLLLQQSSSFVDGRVARNRLISLSPSVSSASSNDYESRPWQIEGFRSHIYLWWIERKESRERTVSRPCLWCCVCVSRSPYLSICFVSLWQTFGVQVCCSCLILSLCVYWCPLISSSVSSPLMLPFTFSFCPIPLPSLLPSTAQTDIYDKIACFDRFSAFHDAVGRV